MDALGGLKGGFGRQVLGVRFWASFGGVIKRVG